MEERDDWLSKIESRHKYDDETWIPSHGKTIYDQILDDAHADRGRMALVIREFAKIVKLGCSYQEAKWYDGDEENFLAAIENLSPDAKELVK